MLASDDAGVSSATTIDDCRIGLVAGVVGKEDLIVSKRKERERREKDCPLAKLTLDVIDEVDPPPTTTMMMRMTTTTTAAPPPPCRAVSSMTINTVCNKHPTTAYTVHGTAIGIHGRIARAMSLLGEKKKKQEDGLNEGSPLLPEVSGNDDFVVAGTEGNINQDAVSVLSNQEKKSRSLSCHARLEQG